MTLFNVIAYEVIIMEEKKVINLNDKRLDESWMSMFGAQMQYMLDQMGFMPLRGSSNVTIRGLPSQIKAFAGALMGERRHMDAAIRYGLNDPKTYKSSMALNRAIANFERATGIKYPIK